MSQRPWFVVGSADVSEVESAYPEPFDDEKLSLGRDLGRAAGSRALGAYRERLLPGRRTSFTHAHLREEELIYVLSGRPSVRWVPPGGDPQECELAPGDLAAFPAGTGIAHTFVNRTDVDAELLVIGERRPSERVHYPEDLAFAAWRADRRPEREWRDAVEPQGDGRWPVVRIETERLVIRPWTVDDAPDLVRAQVTNQTHLRRWMPWAETIPTLDEMADRVADWQRSVWSGGDVVLGVFLPDGSIVGGTGVHDRIGALGRELGYWVAQEHEGKGYVTEWVAALTRAAFVGLGLDRVEIHCDPDNTRSAAVARRLGYRYEATLPRRALGTDGSYRGSMIFSLYRSDLAGSPCGAPESKAWDGLGRRVL